MCVCVCVCVWRLTIGRCIGLAKLFDWTCPILVFSGFLQNWNGPFTHISFRIDSSSRHCVYRFPHTRDVVLLAVHQAVFCQCDIRPYVNDGGQDDCGGVGFGVAIRTPRFMYKYKNQPATRCSKIRNQDLPTCRKIAWILMLYNKFRP